MVTSRLSTRCRGHPRVVGQWRVGLEFEIENRDVVGAVEIDVLRRERAEWGRLAEFSQRDAGTAGTSTVDGRYDGRLFDGTSGCDASGTAPMLSSPSWVDPIGVPVRPVAPSMRAPRKSACSTSTPAKLSTGRARLGTEVIAQSRPVSLTRSHQNAVASRPPQARGATGTNCEVEDVPKPAPESWKISIWLPSPRGAGR